MFDDGHDFVGSVFEVKLFASDEFASIEFANKDFANDFINFTLLS